MKKRMTAIVCVLVMLLSLLAGCGAKEEAEPQAAEPQAAPATAPSNDAGETFTVHAHIPDTWSNPGIWAWSDTEGNAFEAWPGEQMKSEGNGWYTYEVPSWVTYVIINANDGMIQTADVPIESREVWFCVHEDGSTEYDYVLLEPCGAGAEEAPVQNPDTYILHARVPSSWYNAGIWAWSDTEGDLFDAWPGYELLMGDDGWYYFELPNWINYVIISGNDGNVQTADIPVEAKDLWIVVNDDLSYSLSYQSGGAAPVETVSSEYEAAFTSRGLTDTSLVSGSLKNYSYVMEMDNGLMKVEFGCANGITQELGMVFYFETAGLSADEAAAMDQGMRDMFGSMFASVAGSTVIYRQLTNYYCISAYCTGLDDAAIASQVIDILETMSGASMGTDNYIPEPTDAEYTSAGFIAK